jgi:2-haloacid dehalogenase
MKVAQSDTWLVAAHTWDTIGAHSFGWNAALVTRGINAPLVLRGVPEPTLTGAALTDVADAIVKRVCG